MSSSTDGDKQSQEVSAESMVTGTLETAVVPAEVHGIAPDSFVSPGQNTHETSNRQNEYAGQQRGTMTEVPFMSTLRICIR